MPENRYVVGVDFGTLSGRALVVRVADGAEMGTAEQAYASGVIDTRLPGSDVRLGPDWALQDPKDWVEVLRTAVPAALEASGVEPGEVDRHRHRLHRLHPAAGASPTARRSARSTTLREPAARLAEAVEAPRRPAGSRSDQRPGARARRPWLNRYGGRLSSEWQFAKALELLEEDPDMYARTERLIEAADWIIWQLCGEETRNALHGRIQGHLPGWQLPRPGFPRRADPDFADFVQTKLDHPSSPLGSRAGRLTAEAAALDRATRGHRGGRRQRGRARDCARRRRRSSPARCSWSWAPRPVT